MLLYVTLCLPGNACCAAVLTLCLPQTSDNGSPWDARGSDGNLPLKGEKHELFEGGIKVPAFVIGVGVPAGVENHELTAHVDWLPTLVTLAGRSLCGGPPLDGLDIWATITGGAKSPHTELLHNFDDSVKPVKVSGPICVLRILE